MRQNPETLIQMSARRSINPQVLSNLYIFKKVKKNLVIKNQISNQIDRISDEESEKERGLKRERT